MSAYLETIRHWAQALLPVLLDAAAKGAVLLAAAGAATAAMRKSSAAARQLVWLLALAALLVLPLVSAALPGWRVLPGWARLEVPPAAPTEPAAPARGETERPPGDAGLVGPSAMAAHEPQPLAAAPPLNVEPEPPAFAPREPTVGPPAAPVVAPPPAPAPSPAGPFGWTILLPWALLLWALGTAACLLPLVLGRVSLWRLARASRRIDGGSWGVLASRAAKALGLRRGILLLQSHAEPMPMVWGTLRPRLLLPAEADDWPAERRWIVLLHELAHARRRDCLAKFIAHVACAAYWFNPLCWAAFKRMQTEAEAACDDLVLAAGHRPSDYAAHLLEIASGLKAGMLAAYSSIAMARRRHIEGRVLAILDDRRNRRALTRWTVIAAVAAIAALAIPMACLKAPQVMRFTEATVTLRMDLESGKYVPSSQPWAVLKVTDPRRLERLLAFFPQLGKESNRAAGWEEGAVIELRKHDGSNITIHVAVNDDLQTWTWGTGKGDWPVRGDLKAFLLKLQKEQSTSQPATQSAATDSLQGRLAKLGVEYNRSHKIVVVGSEADYGHIHAEVPGFEIQTIWDSIIQARPLYAFAASGERRVEFYAEEDAKKPAVVLLVNSTGSVHIEGMDSRGDHFYCPNLHSLIMALLDMEYKRRNGDLSASKPATQPAKSGLPPRLLEELDLSALPATTKTADLPDLFEERPSGSKSWELRGEVQVRYSGIDGTVYYLPAKKAYYVQRDPVGSSTRHYYGPITGESAARLTMLLRSTPATQPATSQETSQPATRAAGELSDQQIQALWKDLGDRDAQVAYAAADRLAQGGDAVAAALERHVRPVLGQANDQALRRLIADLNDREFAVRQRATEQISMMGRWPARALRAALGQDQPEETRLRLEELLRDAERFAPVGEGQCRLMRAIHILQRMNTAKARDLLGAIASWPARPLLRYVRAGEFAVEAGFVPDKGEYVWGEKIQYFTLVVRNAGKTTLTFTEGGDYRGGRSESNKITAVDPDGKPVPVPDMPEFGGFISQGKIEPGQTWIKMLPAERRLTFPGPGTFTVTGDRTLQGQVNIPIRTTFPLTIHRYTKERMRGVVADLAAEIRSFGDLQPRDLEYTEPRECTDANRLHLAWDALLAIQDEAVLPCVLELAAKGPPALRASAIRRLGAFRDERAFATVTTQLRMGEPVLKAAAAEALGQIKTDEAVTALLAAWPQADSALADALLEAMGRTGSPRVLDVLTRTVRDQTAQRVAAARGLAALKSPQAVEVLKALAGSEEDMGFREFVVQTVAEGLRQPIDPQWLVPVIRSHRRDGTIGDSPRLLRLYAGERGVPTLLGCLDFDAPSGREYYNQDIIYQQAYCRGGLRVRFQSDLNRDSTPEELAQNRVILKSLRGWVAHAQRRLGRGEPLTGEPGAGPWSEPADGIIIRIRPNTLLWPEDLPQLIQTESQDHPGGGSVLPGRLPQPLEVEVNGQWYSNPDLKGPTEGPDRGHGTSFGNILLDGGWKRLSDGKALALPPGKYTVRVRLSTADPEKRTGLAVSPPVEFEVVSSEPPAESAPAPRPPTGPAASGAAMGRAAHSGTDGFALACPPRASM